jgi:gamma-glutamyl hercynylcysteine S-oxide hydrolase
VIAAVRGATAPAPTEESGTPPFSEGRWLFAHNGAVDEFRTGAGARLRRTLTIERETAILGAADSEVLFQMVLTQLDEGAAPGEALAAVVACVQQVSGGRLNLVLGDGEVVAATRVGDSLWALADADGRRSVIASEPTDGDDRWVEVPDGSVVEASAGDLQIRPLPD